ncbi:type II toxin-antitoxin system Phd/YefM family antitoxin [Sphaerospermopsis sp. LEGE 08334]|uniref:type II toxin-antitoxin system Phd/YefM family antitoxin n=1 Tax=Sphaerospermopsis sp. LEGE 08334 TaxID=1828651 RepID=UPI001D14B561|nr:type II toxin-antitoxin system Phd/YefM family antitoxin [Sphaerospermopsis sp. LEGE 08334]
MSQITLSELPPILQTLINQAKKTGETLTITDNGIPLAIISPVKKKSLLEVFANLEDIDTSLKPYDMAVLAAILVRAEYLQQQGFSWVGFCELDSDLQPWDKNGVKKPILSDLYNASHVWVYRDFLVEDVDELPEVWFY